MRVAIYTRVSTAQQTTQNQLIELRELAQRAGWTIVDEYSEVVSGTKGASDRSELARMLLDASRKRFDKIVVWSVDRLGRDMTNLVYVLNELNELGIHLFSYKQGLDTETAMGKTFFYMTGIFAELENNMRKERQQIGIKRAIAGGAKFGRKSKLDQRMMYKIRSLRGQKQSMRKIASQLNISVATVHKACSEMVVEKTGAA